MAATGQFIFKATDEYYNNHCHEELFLTSVYAAAKTYCAPEEIIAGSESVGKRCNDYGFTTLSPYEEFKSRLTDALIPSLPVVNYEDTGINPMWNTIKTRSKKFSPRVPLTLRSFLLKPKPNQHYFLYQPFKWRGWENHPFTAPNWSHVSDESSASDSSQLSSPPGTLPSAKENNGIAIAPVSSPSQAPSSDSSQAQGRVKLTFYVRRSTPSSGSFTNQIPRLCLTNGSSQPVSTRLLLEGPYGSHESLSHFDNVLLITGGTGISAALPYLKFFLQLNANQRPTNVQFIWTTKQARMVHEIFNRELSSLPTSPNVQVKTFITGDKTIDPTEKSSDDDKKPFIAGALSLGVTYGRPDLKSLVENMAEEKGKGSMAVFVCGPAGMADQVRAVVKGCLDRGVRRIELIEEVFGW
ncbi:hypothetical protein ONS95_010613 [Cadophora gregata]|uniref:uncharacterized protein n=1 Tax=Cadophora gregata TaxID=51156 RepID=UPI0026DAD096|nr:uncharacterized protein ONS95_010613 [Cadophora gregata]KAK0122372.1 hypothetical protein ONS95_010613 [Cadophora gregata]